MANKPDYRLHALNKESQEKNRIGAGWINDDGSISIRLDAFVKLEAGPNLVLTMFLENKGQ